MTAFSLLVSTKTVPFPLSTGSALRLALRTSLENANYALLDSETYSLVWSGCQWLLDSTLAGRSVGAVLYLL